MANYNFGGGLSGEVAKVNYRTSNKWETGKAIAINKLDRNYVNMLSCVKSVTIKGTRVSKSSLTFKLPSVKKLFVVQDSKTKQWHALDQIKK